MKTLPVEIRTLAIDIGGTGIKCATLGKSGKLLTKPARVATPRPATPRAVLEVIARLATAHEPFARVSAAFPGVVRNGVIETAANLHPSWKGVDLAKVLSRQLGRPARVANDADVQGLGTIEGRGIELVLTLGTGLGSALFVDGKLVPNLETAHHPFRKGKTYEDYLGLRALTKAGKKKWNKHLRLAIGELERMFNYDSLILGGGNSAKIIGALPPNTRIVNNVAGLIGGIALWSESPRTHRE